VTDRNQFGRNGLPGALADSRDRIGRSSRGDFRSRPRAAPSVLRLGMGLKANKHSGRYSSTFDMSGRTSWRKGPGMKP
jgi:hypothetical protein